jgi:3-demethoxyubiquinol 3-hydroxylase
MSGPRRLPGDPPAREIVERIIRVDHAGEFGAKRIYAGQLAVLGNTPSGPVIRRMAEAEDKHLAEFERLIARHHVRPTALAPLWHVTGFMLGAATALMGTRAAMACTVAIEEVIDEHYRAQAERLGEAEPELKASIEAFRRDELDHRDTGLAHEAAATPGYDLLTGAIKAGSRLAIWLSERI